MFTEQKLSFQGLKPFSITNGGKRRKNAHNKTGLQPVSRHVARFSIKGGGVGVHSPIDAIAEQTVFIEFYGTIQILDYSNPNFTSWNKKAIEIT